MYSMEYFFANCFVCVSDGNLATKQVVFLQRPVRSQAAAQHRNQVRNGQQSTLHSGGQFGLVDVFQNNCKTTFLWL